MVEPGERTRVRIDLAYDGAGFSGWARQPGLRTVQGELESALETLVARAGDPPPTLVVAGRTDAGVHALGQVAHTDLTPAQLAAVGPGGATGPGDATDSARLARALNGIAGRAGDLHVHRAAIAPAGFDARFSGVWRRYAYRVADADALHDPTRRTATLWHPSALDVDRMDAAARALPALADWAAFCRPREGATTVRTLLDFAWRRDADGVLLADVRADAFCHSMVRALVGASIAVGEGRLAPERMRELRDGARRESGFAVAPAHGLTLVEIGYPPDEELAARAEQTRARRGGVHDAGPFDRPPRNRVI